MQPIDKLLPVVFVPCDRMQRSLSYNEVRGGLSGFRGGNCHYILSYTKRLCDHSRTLKLRKGSRVLPNTNAYLTI